MRKAISLGLLALALGTSTFAADGDEPGSYQVFLVPEHGGCQVDPDDPPEGVEWPEGVDSRVARIHYLLAGCTQRDVDVLTEAEVESTEGLDADFLTEDTSWNPWVHNGVVHLQTESYRVQDRHTEQIFDVRFYSRAPEDELAKFRASNMSIQDLADAYGKKQPPIHAVYVVARFPEYSRRYLQEFLRSESEDLRTLKMFTLFQGPDLVIADEEPSEGHGTVALETFDGLLGFDGRPALD